MGSSTTIDSLRTTPGYNEPSMSMVKQLQTVYCVGHYLRLLIFLRLMMKFIHY